MADRWLHAPLSSGVSEDFPFSSTSACRAATSSSRRPPPNIPPTRARPSRKPAVRVLTRPGGGGDVWETFGRSAPPKGRKGHRLSTLQTLELGSHFFQKPFRRNLECLRQPERYLDGRGSQTFLQPGNIAVLKTAVGGQVHLRPTLLQTPFHKDIGECQTKLPEVFQAAECRGSTASVSLTIGKPMDP